jgi:two-component system chemotaxis sensor kinase CheA
MTNTLDQDLLKAFFEDAHDVLQEWEKVTLSLNPGDSVKAYEPILRCAHNLKGSAAMTGLPDLQAKIHRIEDYLVKIRDLGRGPSAQIIAAFLQVEQMLRRWVEKIKTEPFHVEDTTAVENSLALLVSTESESQVDPGAASELPTQTTKIQKSKNTGDSLRVSVGKLDHLIQLVGEISLQQSILERVSKEGTLNSTNVGAVIDLKSKLTQDLQDAALSLRMIPVAGLFQRIERAVVETAHQLGKQVNVRRIGDEVSMDKLVVDGMLDPLIHIARNAVDHGIESIMERVQAGKSPTGEIKMSAENNAAGVTIHFEDDGKGIDAERVFEKAIERGLVSVGDSLTDTAKLNLIFLPGLSTAEQVTEYSGRGVGMDVVADTVKKMGGRVEIYSTGGRGTRFTVSLPTNLSILDALIVKVDGCQYAIPTQDLSEVVDLREFRIQTVNGGDGNVIDLRGKIVPVEDLASFLKSGATTPSSSADKANRSRPGIIALHREDLVALEVDAVIGQQQIFVRPLTGHLAPIGFYGGSTILSDGEPTIILNLPEMARLYFTSH